LCDIIRVVIVVKGGSVSIIQELAAGKIICRIGIRTFCGVFNQVEREVEIDLGIIRPR
jgi:hypothetical protein